MDRTATVLSRKICRYCGCAQSLEGDHQDELRQMAGEREVDLNSSIAVDA